MIHLSELQLDALGELFNIGVGRAADSLSQIVNDEVKLSAPSISLLRAANVATNLLASEFRRFSTVSLDFSGPFEARSMLIFPERNALVIVANMLEENLSPEELAEFEQEAMCEVGNIILNACISALADLFEVEFHGGLPRHHYIDNSLISVFNVGEDEMVLILEIDLMVSQQRVEGDMLFLLGVNSLAELVKHLDNYLIKQGMM